LRDHNVILSASLKSQFLRFVFLTSTESAMAGSTYSELLCLGMCRTTRSVGLTQKGQRKNVHAYNWLFAQATHVDVALSL